MTADFIEGFISPLEVRGSSMNPVSGIAWSVFHHLVGQFAICHVAHTRK